MKDRTEHIIEGVALIIICVLALLGNISLWIIILRTRCLREQAYYMILILSFADILVSVVSMPFTIHTILSGGWGLSNDACVAVGFLTMLTFIASVMSLGCISLNRYVKICLAKYYPRIYTTFHVVLMALGVWFISFLLALPPLIGWGQYGFIGNQSFCFCEWKSSPPYTIFMIAVCFGGPFIVMTFCYFNILRIFRNSRKRLFGSVSRQPKFAPPSCFSKVFPDTVSTGKIEMKIDPVNESDNFAKLEAAALNHNIIDSDSQKPEVTSRELLRENNSYEITRNSVDERNERQERRKSRRQKDEFILALSLLIVIVVFIVCWLPFCITMFLNVFTFEKVPRAADMFTLLLGYANSCFNPFIYGFMNKRFKTGYRRLFRDVITASCKSSGTDDSDVTDLDHSHSACIKPYRISTSNA